ncbi:MAG: ribonuclease HI [Spirochaeta sp.]|nr:ribonuclease HI [Spirochaeta sp.]
MADIKIFTDGGCSGNPGPGAWSFIILKRSFQLQNSGSVEATTNNRMELTAVISALIEIETRPELQQSKIDLYTDSRYVQRGISEWIEIWERNGWLTVSKKPVKNQDLWKKLKVLSGTMKISWHWLEGHRGHEFNERCDRLVQEEIKKIKYKSSTR